MRAVQLILASLPLLALPLISLECSSQNVQPGTNTQSNALCTFPSACYLTACDCRRGAQACRVLPANLSPDLGLGRTDLGNPEALIYPYAPQPSDPGTDCPINVDMGPALPPLMCALPEQICPPGRDIGAASDGGLEDG